MQDKQHKGAKIDTFLGVPFISVSLKTPTEPCDIGAEGEQLKMVICLIPIGEKTRTTEKRREEKR